MEMLKDSARTNVVHFPDTGNASANVAILANGVQAVFGSMPALLQVVRAEGIKLD